MWTVSCERVPGLRDRQEVPRKDWKCRSRSPPRSEWGEGGRPIVDAVRTGYGSIVSKKDPFPKLFPIVSDYYEPIAPINKHNSSSPVRLTTPTGRNFIPTFFLSSIVHIFVMVQLTLYSLSFVCVVLCVSPSVTKKRFSKDSCGPVELDLRVSDQLTSVCFLWIDLKLLNMKNFEVIFMISICFFFNIL